MARAMACHSAAWSVALSPSSRGCSRPGAVKASLTEPKWKQKLAAADEKSEKIKQLTLQAQEEYRKRQLQKRESGGSSKGLVRLAELQFLPYLSEEGLINDCSQENAKATLYAVFDEDKMLQYIGISRQIHHSMRLHFARLPGKCYFVKVYHSETPSRSILEMTRDRWIADSSTPPSGNVDPREQYIWENPFDCKPLMTGSVIAAEEVKLHEEANGAAKAKVLKNVARRVEKTLVTSFDDRKCKETLRFDPKLKERGLLDLKNLPTTPKRKMEAPKP